ncbi:L,D-transpeptidase family protein [Cytobacillus suaedae]|nr:L,D-transpeptidase family protein [Cytobacillus suaedae]
MEQGQQETRKQKYQKLKNGRKVNLSLKPVIVITLVLGMCLVALLPDTITLHKPKLLQSEQVVAAESYQNTKQLPQTSTRSYGEMVIDHKVSKGETIFSISKKYYTSNHTDKILSYNGITKPEEQVKQGMILSIPNPEFLEIHIVKKGETLFSISNLYFSRTNLIEYMKNANKIKDPTTDIKVGMRISIPAREQLVLHTVKEKETLYGMMSTYYELANYQKRLADFNDIHNPSTDLKVGMELKVPNLYHIRMLNKNERIEIDTTTNLLTYYKNNEEVLKTKVATGKNNLTPKGTFEIVLKLKNPAYTPKKIAGGTANNPLGTRWIGLNINGTEGRTYGIHGTNNPSSIGSNASIGCIRLENKKVEWLFDQVSEGTLVIIK